MTSQHVTCRSSAYHLRDLRCSPPLLDRLYQPIALHFDTPHVRRRHLLVQKRYISCRPVSCKFSCFARPRHEPVQPRIRHLAHRFHLICPYLFYLLVLWLYLLRRTTGGPLQASRSWAHPVHASIYIVVPLDLQVVLVNRRRRYGIFATPPTHSRYVYLISIVICTVYN